MSCLFYLHLLRPRINPRLTPRKCIPAVLTADICKKKKSVSGCGSRGRLQGMQPGHQPQFEAKASLYKGKPFPNPWIISPFLLSLLFLSNRSIHQLKAAEAAQVSRCSTDSNRHLHKCHRVTFQSLLTSFSNSLLSYIFFHVLR